MENDISGKSKGGKARAKALTPEQRKDIAVKAAQARWELPQAEYSGELKLGELVLPAAVLSDGTRVLTETDFMEGLKMYRSGALSVRRKEDPSETGAQTPLYLAFKNLKPFIDKHLPDVHSWALKYRTEKGNVAHGIKAELIPKICDVWLDADAAGVLGPRQKQVAANALMLMRGLAHVGIIALVDEATGYQEVRARDALHAYLDRFLRKELAAWVKRFPDDFFREIYRLKKWKWTGSSRRPSVVGRYLTDIIYSRLGPGILDELEKLNPKIGNKRRGSRHHQWLTEDVGHPALAQHLYAVTGLMRMSDNWQDFMKMLNKGYPKKDLDQLELFFS